MDEALRKAGLLTLDMLSVNGECPFGGRSNQFLNNEAQIAIVCEYEARRYASLGDLTTAGRFKAAVNRALASIEGYLNKDVIRHIKNNFDLKSKYGCEVYAYFDKYMITTASFLYAAYLVSDDKIAPVEDGYFNTPKAFKLSEDFHKVFLRAGGYSLEFDTSADPHYDASGLGRIHKEGVPSVICMSTPCTPTPNYTIDRSDAIALSFAVGVMEGENPYFATGKETLYEILSFGHDDVDASAKIKNIFPSGKEAAAEYILNENGVDIIVTGIGEVLYMLPLFYYNGENYSEISVDGKSITVSYDGWKAIYETDGEICELSGMGCNRNGYYKPYYAKGDGALKIKIRIERA